MSRHGEGHENKCQAAEDEGLDDAHQEFQTVERQSEQKRHQERGHQQQYLSRRHVAEETEGEADDADEHAEKLDEADEDVDDADEYATESSLDIASEKLAETAEELAEGEVVLKPPNAQRAKTEECNGHEGHESDCQGGVDVRVGASE